MEKKEHYRQVFLSFRNLCAENQQPCSFTQYCKEHGVERTHMRKTLGKEYQNIQTLPGYVGCVNSHLYATIYENFKNLCAAGKQPGTFKDYCAGFGVSRPQIHSYLKNHGLRVAGLPGYEGPAGTRMKKCQSIPFEDVIFEEAGFIPAAPTNVITVSIDGHVAVSFPAETDVAVIARFIKKMGKEAGHVES